MLTRRAWLEGALAASLHSQQVRPNIVVILLDDLGSADLGYRGATDIPTPHIDALARESVIFNHAYATHPFCSPTRAGILTGRYPQRFGYENNPLFDPASEHLGLPLEQKTLAEVLRGAGYRTGMIGKWHLGAAPKFHPLKRGFTESYGFMGGGHDYFEQGSSDPKDSDRLPMDRNGKHEKTSGYLTEILTREAVSFVERAGPNEPFFLHLAYNAPHSPLQAPKKYLDRMRHIANEERRTYGAMIAAADDGIGEVLAAIRKRGLARNTLVFFAGDNGGTQAEPKTSNAPFRGYKGSLYEGGIRVPFLLRWSGRLPAGKAFDDPVLTLDLFATACRAAGVEMPAGRVMDSANLVPYIDRLVKGWPHTALYWRVFEEVQAIRSHELKLIRHAGKPVELYDVVKDPGEAHDLAAQKPDTVKWMTATLDRWIGELPKRLF